MQAKSTVCDSLSAIARIGSAIIPRMVGAYMGFRLGRFRGIGWGWRYLRIHPFSVFLVEAGGKLEGQGRLHIGFALNPDVPLPGKRRTGLVIKKNGTFRSGKDVHLLIGSTVHVSENAVVEIGDRTFVGYDSTIVAREKIAIGAVVSYK